ncbi:HlyC/CorC family transporter [bacterium]|nr:HlyC/CorC family transporter [candidate division CSSED10-310 bacterium]
MTDILLCVGISLASIFFSYYETCFRSLSRVKMRLMLQGGEDGDQVPFNPDILDISLNLTLTLLNAGVLLLAFRRLQQMLGDSNLAMLLSFAVVVLFVIVFNLAAPGFLLHHKRESFTSAEIAFLKLPYYLLYPLSAPIQWSFNAALSLRRGENGERTGRGAEELETLIDVGQEEGLFEEAEGELLHSVVEFSETLVREVMTPRTDIVSVQLDEGLGDLHEKFVSSGHSRIPVYGKTIDDIVGIVHVKDLIRCFKVDAGCDSGATIESLMKPPYYIPETKLVSRLLREFQDEKIQLAIVVDEYGGVEGLVSLEDLLEEIVGEIKDEYDQEPDELVIESDASVVVDAKIDIEDVEDHFKIKFPVDEYETISGFIFHELGKVPAVGEVLHFQDLIFTVISSDERRIYQVRIQRKESGSVMDGETA